MRNFLFCLLLVVVLYAASAEAKSKFDPVSSAVADATISLLSKFPHSKIPLNDTSDTGALTDYGKSVAFIIAPAFVLAILTLLVGIFYGVFKIIRLCCSCCCRNKNKKKKSLQMKHVVRPTVAHTIIFLFLFTGALFALANNAYFTGGVHSMLDAVSNLTDSTIELALSLIKALLELVGSIPGALHRLVDTMSDVPGIKTSVDQLGVDLNQTSGDIEGIKMQLNEIDGGNFSAIIDTKNRIASLSNSSAEVLANMTTLIDEIGTNLATVLNDTIGTMGEREDQINQTTSNLITVSNDLMSNVQNVTDDVKGYLNQASHYDSIRLNALNIAFSVCILTCLLIIPACVFKIKLIFNVFAAIGVIFTFIAFFSGGIHLVVGFLLNDVCPIIDPFVQSNLPSGDVGNIINGCFNGRPLLQSLDTSGFNLSTYFNYNEQFDNFTDFIDSFNFTKIDTYFDDINALRETNLTAAAANMTVESYGWDEQIIYTTLERLDNQTEPFGDYFTLDNYTLCDPSTYPSNVNESIADTKELLTNLIEENKTIHALVNKTQHQMIAVQDSIDAMLYNVSISEIRYDGVKVNITNIKNVTIPRAKGILMALEGEVNDFLQQGNCSFLKEGYDQLLGGLCDEIQPATDLLMLGQMLIGFTLIGLIVISEVLGARIRFLKENQITFSDIKDYFFGASKVKSMKSDQNDDDDGDSSDAEKGRRKSLPSVAVGGGEYHEDGGDQNYESNNLPFQPVPMQTFSDAYNNNNNNNNNNNFNNNNYNNNNFGQFQPVAYIPVTLPPPEPQYSDAHPHAQEESGSESEGDSRGDGEYDGDNDDMSEKSKGEYLPPIRK